MNYVYQLMDLLLPNDSILSPPSFEEQRAADDSKSSLLELPLDSRWDLHDGTFATFYHNHPQHEYDPSTLTASSVSVNDMITTIQNVNRCSVNILTDIGNTNILQNNQKNKRLKRVKQEIQLNRRKHEYRKRLLDYKLYALGQTPSNFARTENVEKQDQPVPSYHLLRDFDDIQQLYDNACLDAYNTELDLVNIRKTQSEIDQENMTLAELAHSYFFGPLFKDENYREINTIFHDFDDDPFQMVVNDDQAINSNHVYPKLKVLSKRTEQDRQKRRQLLLSSVKDQTDEDEKWSVEVDRVSSLLSKIISN